MKEKVDGESAGGGRTEQVAVLDRAPLGGNPGLSLSPDRKYLLHSPADALAADLKLVENFR